MCLEAHRALHELTQQPGPPDVELDSSFVRFLRLIMRYPEIIAWDQLWHDDYQDFQKRIYGEVNFLAPGAQVGWHVWHHNSFSPLYRAQMDFSDMASYSDFLKPVLYNDCGGYRLHHHIRQVARSIFQGVDEQVVFDLYRGVLGYEEGARFEDLPALGLSARYVINETRRTVRAVSGKARVYPGLDIDIPTPDYAKKTAPEGVRACAEAVIEAGADGLVLSRKYSEMTMENLEAVGATLAVAGKGWV